MNELINHLWQSTAFVLLIALAVKTLRRNSPRLRYWLWLTASIKFLIPFSLIVSTGGRIQLPRETPLPHADTVVQISTYFEPVSEKYFQPASESSVAIPERAGFPWRTAVTAVWLMGGFLLAVRWFRRWRTIHRAVGRATRLTIPQFTTQGSVPILSSPALLEPGVFGLFRPVLLLPEGIAEKLTPEQFEAVLAHEFRHIRCFDNLTAAIHMSVETLFWFHPLVWWIGAKLIDERERDCDEAVLRQGSQPADYARGIVQVCDTYIKTELACASGISGSDLKKRVREIMTWRGSLPVTLSGKAILIAGAIAAVSVPFAIGVLRAQTKPIPVQSSQIPSQIAQNSTRSETPQGALQQIQPRSEASPNLVGDYTGSLPESLRQITDSDAAPVWLHIKADAGGKLSATLEYPERRGMFLLTDVRLEGQSFSFTVPGASWKGSIENNGERLNGVYTNPRASSPLVFERATAQTQIRPEAQPNAVRPAGIPKWEAVSIKPCPPGSDGPGRSGDNRSSSGPKVADLPFRFSPDRMILNCRPVRALIRSAYHLYSDTGLEGDGPLALVLAVGGSRKDRMDKVPDWVDDDRYTIEAKAERVTSKALMQGPMLQAILEDRFNIQVRWEPREVAGEALVIAKGGSKLKRFVEGSCIPIPAGYTSPLSPEPPKPGEPHFCRLGGGGLNLNRPGIVKNIVYDGEGITLDEFIKMLLIGNGDRLVIDKTGLTGKFDIHLEWAISDETRERLAGSKGADRLGPSTAPPFPEALQQQLGLKLESAKGPVDFLVVDHIDRPSPN